MSLIFLQIDLIAYFSKKLGVSVKKRIMPPKKKSVYLVKKYLKYNLFIFLIG
jgi:hypothetical protein